MKINIFFLFSLFIFNTATAQTETENYYSLKAFRFSNPSKGTLPIKESVDSLHIFCPPPMNQGKTKACIGFAFAAAASISYAYRNQDKKRLEFSPYFLYNQIQIRGGGSHGYDAVNKLEEKGICTKETFNDINKEQPPPNAFHEARQFKINPFTRVFDSLDRDKAKNLQRVLSEYVPIVVTLKMGFEWCFTPNDSIWQPNKKSGKCDSLRSEHAIVVVGFKDSTFEILNSWGEIWGTGGFARIRFEDINQYADQAYAIQVNGANYGTLETEPSDHRDGVVTLQQALSYYKNTEGDSLPYFEPVVSSDCHAKGDTIFELIQTDTNHVRVVFAERTGKKAYFFTLDSESKFYADIPTPIKSDTSHLTWLHSPNNRGMSGDFDWFCTVFLPKELSIDSLKAKVKALAKDTSKEGIRQRIEAVFGDADESVVFKISMKKTFKVEPESLAFPKEKPLFDTLKQGLNLRRAVEDARGGWVVIAQSERKDTSVLFLRFSQKGEFLGSQTLLSGKQAADSEPSDVQLTKDGCFIVTFKNLEKDTLFYLKVNEFGHKIWQRSSVDASSCVPRFDEAQRVEKKYKEPFIMTHFTEVVMPVLPNKNKLPSTWETAKYYRFKNASFYKVYNKTEDKTLFSTLDAKHKSIIINDLLATRSGKLIAFGKQKDSAWFDVLTEIPNVNNPLKDKDASILQKKGFFTENGHNRLIADEQGYFHLTIKNKTKDTLYKNHYAVVKPIGPIAEGLRFYDTVIIGQIRKTPDDSNLYLPFSLSTKAKQSGRTRFEVEIFEEGNGVAWSKTEFEVETGNIFIDNETVFGQKIVFNDSPLNITLYSPNALKKSQIELLPVSQTFIAHVDSIRAKSDPITETAMSYEKDSIGNFRYTISFKTKITNEQGERFVVRTKHGNYSNTILVLPKQRKPILWVVSVGVVYNDAAQNALKYTQADAVSMDSFCRTQAGGHYCAVIGTNLTTLSETGYGNLNTTFKSLEKYNGQMQAEDRVIVYFSSHGTHSSNGQALDFNIKTANDSLLNFQKDIFPVLKTLPCPVFVFVDACRDSANSKFLPPTILDTLRNVSVLMSSSPGEQSYEYDKAKHGAFTVALIDFLHTAKQNTLSFEEIAQYCIKHVKEMGKVQTPVAYGAEKLRTEALFYLNVKNQ